MDGSKTGFGRLRLWSLRTVPAGSREWAEAVWAELEEVPADARRSWAAGAAWLVAKEAGLIRRSVYWLAIASVAAGMAEIARLIWLTPSVNPYATAESRVLTAGTAVLLVALPLLGRRTAVFGPVADNSTARLVRLAGCAGVCLLVLALSRLAESLNVDFVHRPVSISLIWIGLISTVLLVITLIVQRERGQQEVSELFVCACTLAPFIALMLFFLDSDWVVVSAYAAVFLAITARGSRVSQATLSLSGTTGILAGAIVFVLWAWQYLWFVGRGSHGWLGTTSSLMIPLVVIAAPVVAGFVATRRFKRDDPEAFHRQHLRQGIAAGLLTGTSAALIVAGLSFGFMVVLHRQDPPHTTVPFTLALLVGPGIGVCLATVGAGLAGDFWSEHGPSDSGSGGPGGGGGGFRPAPPPPLAGVGGRPGTSVPDETSHPPVAVPALR